MIRKIYGKVMNDSLYKNSIYLMLSTAITAGLGFFFWMIVTRLYTPEKVGLASTLISIISLITTFSLLGLNTALVRYLPTSERKNDKINTVFTISVLATLVVTTIFLLGINTFSPKLMFIKENLYYAIFFIASMIFMTLFTMIDSVLLAYRSAKYTLVKSSIFGVVKVILPLLLVSLGAMGIFGSVTIAAGVAFVYALIVLIVKFGYKLKPVLYDDIIKRMFPYSFGNYVAGFFGSLPTMILPLMITNRINAETTAYYYIAMMMANLLFVIPQATTNSLFAEGSYDEREFKKQIKKAFKVITLILIPAILFMILFGKYVLMTFGDNYSTEGFIVLELLALSGVFISINCIGGTVFMVKHKIKQLIFINILGSSLILILSYLLIQKGLMGIGLAWVIGQSIVSMIYLGLIKEKF